MQEEEDEDLLISDFNKRRDLFLFLFLFLFSTCAVEEEVVVVEEEEMVKQNE